MVLFHWFRARLQALIGAALLLCLMSASGFCYGAAGTIQVLIGAARIAQHTGQQRPALRGDDLYEGDTEVLATAPCRPAARAQTPAGCT